MSQSPAAALSKWATLALFLLRLAVGWHFTFEAYSKLRGPGRWTSRGYLSQATGPLAPAFKSVAEFPPLLVAADLLMTWGMLALGVAFTLGLFTRTTGAGLAVMLLLFYLSMPPWGRPKLPAEEGNYLYVNKNLIELLAVAVVVASGVSRVWGLDALWTRRAAANRAPEAKHA